MVKAGPKFLISCDRNLFRSYNTHLSPILDKVPSVHENALLETTVWQAATTTQSSSLLRKQDKVRQQPKILILVFYPQTKGITMSPRKSVRLENGEKKKTSVIPYLPLLRLSHTNRG